MALYRSTGLYVNSLHTKDCNTWATGFEYEIRGAGLKLVVPVHMVSNKKIS